MAESYDGNAVTLATWLLAQNTLLMLESKGALTHDEAKDIVEFALLNLESHEATFDAQGKLASQGARVMLEQFRTILARPLSGRLKPPKER